MIGIKITEFSYKYMTYPIDRLRKRVHIVVDVIETLLDSFAESCSIMNLLRFRDIRMLD